jgi:hypothetical protein
MIYASLGLDWSQYAKGLSDAAKSTQSAFGSITKALAGGDIKGAVTAMGSALTSIPGPLVAIATGAAIVAVAAKGMWDAMGKAKEMNIMAEQAGMSATQFSVLSKVFGKIGIDAEQLPAVMSKMAASMADISDPGSKAAQALKKIGISAAMLDGQSQYDQFKLISKGINELSNASSKMQVARAIFGRGGATLLPGMKLEAIAGAEKKISPMAQISEESGGAFLAFQGAVKGLKVDITGFFGGMASEVVPALQSVVEGLGKAARWLNGVLADAGKLIGGGLSFWITSVKEGFSGILAAMTSVFGGLILLMMNVINSGIVAIYSAADSIKQKLGFSKSTEPIPQIDTTNVANNLENLLKPINDRIQSQKEEAAAKRPPPFGGLELGKPQAAGFNGIPDLSSLQKVGGGSALLSGGQDNSPAYQSVRIQEDIRTYIKQLIDVVKQGGQDYQIAPAQSGNMVLTA